MGKIAIDVRSDTAARWENIPDEKKLQLSEKIDQFLQVRINDELSDFLAFVEEIRNEALANGITEEELNTILGGS